MTENSFSIIIPFGKHPEWLSRAVKSIIIQTYPKWELLVVDDGTGVDVESLFPLDERITVLHQPHLNRCFARNLGMAHAKNDWICWLDADDSYVNCYLEVLNEAINEFPDYKLFTFGSVVFRKKGTRAEEFFRDTVVREPFEHEPHAEFQSGRIATGNFIFHRSCYEDVGGLPEVTNPYTLADKAKEEFPKLMEWYGPRYLEGGKELGNPYGDDYYQYYKLTRKYEHKTLPYYLYIQFAHL